MYLISCMASQDGNAAGVLTQVLLCAHGIGKSVFRHRCFGNRMWPSLLQIPKTLHVHAARRSVMDGNRLWREGCRCDVPRREHTCTSRTSRAGLRLKRQVFIWVLKGPRSCFVNLHVGIPPTARQMRIWSLMALFVGRWLCT